MPEVNKTVRVSSPRVYGLMRYGDKKTTRVIRVKYKKREMIRCYGKTAEGSKQWYAGIQHLALPERQNKINAPIL